MLEPPLGYGLGRCWEGRSSRRAEDGHKHEALIISSPLAKQNDHLVPIRASFPRRTGTGEHVACTFLLHALHWHLSPVLFLLLSFFFFLRLFTFSFKQSLKHSNYKLTVFLPRPTISHSKSHVAALYMTR